MHGMRLENGDRSEHLPYVLEGFVVVAYELSGAEPTPEGYGSFSKAQGGLVNGLAALAFASRQVPFVDSSKIFAAGHSSAGDAALLLAAHAPSLKGAAIYNSAGDGCWFQTRGWLKRVAGSHPHLPEFCQRTRAANHVGHLAVPLFLFTSREDTTCPSSSVEALAAQLHQAGRACKLVEVSQGDHYSSMLEQGLPAAIAWMRSFL
jgi:dipeptidyl aminopeptidase/acylaminoacyl peptidase